MKMQSVNVDTGNEKKAKINWGKVVGGAARGASSMFEPVMPVTIGTISNTTNLLRDLRNARRATRITTQRQQSSARNSSDNKRSLNLFKSALDDIQSGSFTMDKINNDLFDDYESDTADSFKMPSGDDAASMSSEEILLLGNKGVAQSIIQSSSAQLRGLQESSKALINANIKSTQALGLSINNTLQFGFNSINTTLTIQNQKLDSINKNIAGLLEFNNRNALEFYSKSIDMMAGLGKMMENLDRSMNPASRKKDRVLDTSRGFDIREYGKYIKEGIQESLFGAGASAIKGAKSSGKDFGIMGIVAELIIPKAIKEPLQKFDKSMNRFLKEGFRRLSEELNKNDLLQAFGIGDIFGSKRSKINSMNLGKYMKDATPWNGIAQKALVEVIPELLTSIDSKLDNSKKRYYDYGKGQFKTRDKIEEEFRNEYFDTFSTSLRESMDKLVEVASATGRSDTDRLITTIQALIDDRVSGSKDEMTSRRAIESEMKKFGVDATGIKDFILELTDGLDDAISRINDLYHEVGSTQHIYRNINNTAGKEYVNTIKGAHRDRKTNYRSYSFSNKYHIDINSIQDPELRQTVIMLMQNGAKESEINDVIKRAAAVERTAQKVQDKSRIIRTFKSKADTLGKHISRGSESILNPMFKTIFIDDWGRPVNGDGTSMTDAQVAPKAAKKVSVRKVKSSASSRMTNKSIRVSSKEEQSFHMIDTLNQDDYEDYENKSESENDRDYTKLSNALTVIAEAKPSTTVGGIFAQTINGLKSFLGGLMIGFKSFTSRLFGKDGKLKQLWESEKRKKVTDKLKEKLFTGDKAIFKKQYEGAKAGLKRLKVKTLAHLGKGYDFLYDNTMQYMYGAVDENGEPISYKDSEAYKNNKFVSQTLNRKWQRNQRIKKRREEYQKNHAGEQKKTSQTQKTEKSVPNQKEHSKLLGLPAPSQSSTEIRESLEKRKDELYSILIDGHGSNTSKRSNEEVQALRDEFNDIRKRLKAPIEAAEIAIIDTTKKYTEHAEAAVETVVGDVNKSPAKKEKEYKDSFIKKLKRAMPKSLAGAVAGAGVGLLNSSFSLLGGMFLPGGPIAGAIVGGGLSILKNTEAFQSLMYGKLNEKTGAREGGLIGEETRKKFKKLLPVAVGGGVLGGLSAVLKGALGFNSGLGIMGMQLLPGGILGGAILGAGLGILKNSEGFKKMIFGEKGEDGKRSGTFISNSFNKAKEAFKGFMPKVKKAGAGLGLGALTGAVLSNMGYLPAMFSLGGPVGMGIAGLGLGIASSTERFNDWMFGTKDPETGKRRKDGILGRMSNLLRVNVIEPIGDEFKKQLHDLIDFTKLKLFAPFKLAFGPIIDSIKGIKDNVVEFVKDKFEKIGTGILSIMKNTISTLFSPITKAMRAVGKSVLGIGGTIAKLGVAALGAPFQILRGLTAGKRTKEYKDFYKNYYAKGNISGTLKEKWAAEEAAGNKRNIFEKMSDAIGAYTGQGEVADAAREGWNQKMREEGKDHLLWRETGAQNRKIRAERKKRHEEEKKWSKIDKQRRKIVDKDLGGREGVTLTDYQFEKYRDKFKALGIDEQYLQSSEDIMELLYKRDDFKKRLNPIPNQEKDKGENEDGVKLIESEEQKTARENTEKYQNAMKDILSQMAERMGVAADKHLTEEAINSAEDDWKKSKKNLRNRAKRAGVNIDLSNAELRDWEINELKRDELNDYRFSEFYASGDLIGFMKSRGFTQKSKYQSKPKDEPQSETLLLPPPKIESTEIDEERGWSWKFNRSGSSTEAPKSSNGITEWLGKIGNTINDLLNVNKEQRDIAGAHFEVEANGEANVNDVKKRKGKPFGARLVSKFDDLTRFLGFKKKQSKKDAEASENPDAADTALTLGSGEDSSEKEGEKPEEEKSGLAKFWDKVKSVGSAIGGSTVGQFLGKAIKIAGGVGLLGGLGLTIAELIRPGTSNKVGASIDAFNDYVQDEEFSMKKVFTDFSDWFSKTFIGEWWGKTVTPWWNEKVQPWLDDAGASINDFLDNLPQTMETWAKNAGTWITNNVEKLTSALCTVAKEVVPPLVEVVVKTFPTLLKAVGEGVWNGLGFGDKKVVNDEVSETSAKSNLENSGTHSRKNEMTSKTQTSTANALSKLNSEKESERNSVIMNAATGQYYIYDSTKQTQNRKYLDEEAAYVLLEDPNTASDVWIDPITGSYFIEEATYTQYGNNVYMTLDGKAKTQNHVDLRTPASKIGLQMAVRSANGLAPVSKGARYLVRGAGYATKYGGKAVKSFGKGVGKLGLLAKPAGWTMQAGGRGMEFAGDGMIKLSKAGTKAATEAAESAVKASTTAGRYVQNSAGRWIDSTTGKFVKKEIAEAAVETTAKPKGNIFQRLFGGKGAKTTAEVFEEAAEATTNATANKGTTLAQRISNFGKKLSGTKNATKITAEAAEVTANAAGKAGAKITTEAAEVTAKSTGKAGAKLATKAADAVTEVAEKECGTIFQKMSKMFASIKNNKTIANIFGKFKKFMTFNVSDLLGKLVKWLDDIALKCSGKAVGKFATKVSAKVTAKIGKGALTSVPLITIISAAWGLVDGALSAANLFEVPEEDVDWKMVLISSLMEGLLSISVGCWIDLLMDLADMLIGFDLKKEIAIFLYKLLSGNSADAYENLQKSQANLSMEASIYNALNGTNMDAKSYNDKQNKDLLGKIGSGFKSFGNWIVGKGDKNYVESGDAYSDYLKILTGANYSADQISKMSTSEMKSAIKKHVGSSSLDKKTQDKVLNSLQYFTSEGYGLATNTSRINGLYAQGDSRWAKMPIGMLPDGTIATMDRAGCGPTALAAVANTVAARNVGYGPLTPADVGAYAASNGFISQGGANAGLFTEGAARMGLNSSPVSNISELRNNLLADNPVILTGKSNKSSDPYTSAGHIVMADGVYGNNVNVLDPITGKHKLYNIDDISKNTEHAWSYSAGYGSTNPRAKAGYSARTTTSTVPRAKATSASRAATNAAAFTKLEYTTNSTYPTGSLISTNPTVAMKVAAGQMDVSNTPLSNEYRNQLNSEVNHIKYGINDGIVDYGRNGYHTGENGIDTYIMNNNYEYFTTNDTYYKRNYADAIKKNSITLSFKSRDGSLYKVPKLAYILSTQYFGLTGGSYGSIEIKPKCDSSGNYLPISNLTKDMVVKIFAAAIISENVKKGNSFIVAPLSDAEKFLAFCNACRVMYGLANTLTFIADIANYLKKATAVKDSEYAELVRLEASIGDDVTTELTIAIEETKSNGITNPEDLRKFAEQKNTLGKLALIGKIAQAKINCILNGGTDFWTEFGKLTAESSSSSSESSTLTGASPALATAINSPNNIQEELLGKTLENAYRGESGGNYACVINDSNNKASVGPYQANAGNAVKLLKDLQNAQGISYELREKFGNYANIINQGKPLTDDQKSELSTALADSTYSNEIKKAIDKNAMKFYHDTFFKPPKFATYFDNNIFKDLRTLPLLADIGNTNPNNIFDANASNTFMHHWNPTTSDKEFENAYSLLTSNKVYYANSKYANAYLRRIRETYDNLKNYKFKKAVTPGNLSKFFAPGTNPLGFGPVESMSELGDAMTDELAKSEKLQKFSSAMTAISDGMINHLVSKTGIDASDLGLSLSNGNTDNGDNGDGAVITNNTQPSSVSAAGGHATKNGDVLTSVSGTDRARFLAAAKSQIGYLEKSNPSNLKSFTANPGSDNFTKYVIEYKNGDTSVNSKPVSHRAWCNFFTSWAAKAAGIPTSVMYRGWGCDDQIAEMSKKGCKLKSPNSYTPVASDLIFFDHEKDGTSSHIGIVEKADSSGIHIIEGNRDNAVVSRVYDPKSDIIMGYVTPPWTGENKTVDPRELLTLGYGPSRKKSKIDSPAQREQLRKVIENQDDFKVTPKDFEAIGFGPGMAVDAGFDMSSTDGKLDQIFGVIAEWFAESKKTKGASSAATTNVNMIRSNTTNVAPTATSSNNDMNIHKYRDNLINQHVVLSAKENVRNTL